MWDYCGMERTEEGLRKALDRIPGCATSSGAGQGARPGDDLNQELERAGRVADFLELAELMCIDALHRDRVCGGHFRAERQTPDGEARATTRTSPTSPPGSGPAGRAPVLHREDLEFEYVHPTQRSYK